MRDLQKISGETIGGLAGTDAGEIGRTRRRALDSP